MVLAPGLEDSFVLPAPPLAAPARTLGFIRDGLIEAGFGETALRRAYGSDLLRLTRKGLCTELEWRASDGSAAGLLVRLFIGGLVLVGEEVRDLLGARLVEGLLRVGLVRADGPQCQAAVGLTPVGELLFAHDLPRFHRDGAREFVLGPGLGTRAFAELVIRRRVDHVLDLGCGQGVQALLAAAHSRRVIATDLNPRAVAFCEFNARLNGADNVECRRGDCFEPVAGEAFDLIVSNPPFVVSPASTFMYRDADPGFCRKIATAAPTHLSEGGVLQMLFDWPLRAGQDPQEVFGDWTEANGCDSWALLNSRLPGAVYAGLWLRQAHADEQDFDREFRRWMQAYREAGVEQVAGGMLLLRRVSGRVGWRELRDLPAHAGECGASFGALLDARDYLVRVTAAGEPLAARWRLAPELGTRLRQTSTGNGWSSTDVELRRTRGVAFAARVDPIAAGVLGFLDGRRSIGEAAAAWARASRLPPQPLLADLPRLVEKLATLGLLVPASEPGET